MRRFPASLLMLLTACAAGGPAVRPEPPPPPLAWEHPERAARLRAAAEALEPKLEALRAGWKAPGLAVGLVVDGELVWFRGFGERRVSPGAPVDQDTLFRIASMSKAFVSAAVLRLRDEGKVALDEPAERYLPELRRLGAPTADSPRLTVRHLLSHAGGLPEDNATADQRMPMTEAEFDALLAAGLSFSAAPGTQFEYSNLGFALAGRLVSRVSGVPFQEEVRRGLLAPLGMTSTGWEVDALPPERVAVGYGRRGSDMPSAGLEKYADDALHEEPVLHDGAWAALGGLWTTGRDYARWVAFQLAAWPPRDEADAGPVRRASLREAQTVQREYPLDVHRDGDGRLKASAGGYGLGWSVRSTCSFSRVVRHAGGLPGYGSFVALLPDHGVGVFAMTNLTYTTGSEAVDLVLATLQERGLLPQRPVARSPQLAKARGEVLALMASWDAARATAALDRNYQAYETLDGLRARLEAVRTAQGRCQAGDEVEPENALRGKVRLACERGEVELSLELTSDLPPRIQALVLRPALPPDARLREAAARAAALLARWDDGAARALAAPALDLGKARAAFLRAAAEHGACGPPAPRFGDGAGQGTFRLRCERGEVDLSLGLEPAGGRVTTMAAATVDGSVRCPR